MKFKKIFAVLLGASLLLSACTKKQPDGETATPSPSNDTEASAPAETSSSSEVSKDIVVAVNADFISMDAHATRDSLSNSMLSNITEGLVEYDDKLTIQPCLAESYEVSEDGKTYTFKLVEGTKFHDGEAFNSEAIKVNMDRVMEESKGLRNYKIFSKIIESYEATDENTFVFTLKEPSMPFLNRLEAFKILSPKSILENEADIPKNPVGTGQYSFVEWDEGDHLTMKKNPDHRNADKIQVDTVTWKAIPENGTRTALLESGGADLIYPAPLEAMETLEAKEGIEVEVKPSTICRYITMNQNREEFSNKLVRQAMNHAIDKEAYAKVILMGYAEPLNSSMSPVLPFYVEHDPYEYDVEKAKSLLKEAGYPDGFKTTLWGSNDSDTARGMQFISQQLAAVGIEVDVVPMEEGTLSDKVYKTTPDTTELDMWYVNWSANDPDNATRSLFQSDMVPPAGANTNYYNNPAVDTLISEGNKAVEFEEQHEKYKEAQDIVWEDAVWVFMGVDETTLAKKSGLTGAKVDPSGSGVDLREVGTK